MMPEFEKEKPNSVQRLQIEYLTTADSGIEQRGHFRKDWNTGLRRKGKAMRR